MVTGLIFSTLTHAILYAISFGAILILFVSVAGIVWWLCLTVFRALLPRNS